MTGGVSKRGKRKKRSGKHLGGRPPYPPSFSQKKKKDILAMNKGEHLFKGEGDPFSTGVDFAIKGRDRSS